MLKTDRNDMYFKGQSLVEYGLAISLIGVVCIGGLIAFGNSLSGVLSGMKTTMEGGQTAGLNMASTNAQRPSLSSSPVPSNAPASAASNAALSKTCFSNGQCFDRIQVEPYSPTQAVGANGIDLVDQYADTFNHIAKMLENDPDIDPNIHAMLTELALSGHSVADNERTILYSGPHIKFGARDNFLTKKSEVLNYLNQHPGALAPELTEAVNVAANNISSQAQDFLQPAVENPTENQSEYLNSVLFDEHPVNEKYRSGPEYVNVQSNKVCNSGGDTSQCVR